MLVFQTTFLGNVLPPGLNIVVQAVRNDHKNEGYQATGYIKIASNKINMQLFLVQLAETSWKVCTDAVVLPFKAQVNT